MQRYFGIKKDNHQIILENSDMHHIKNVMRMKEHDKIEVVLDRKLYLCEYLNSNIEIINELDQDHELNGQITLAFALIKEQKQDFVLQKGTELGVSQFIPLKMERCVVKLDKPKERWQTICKEASEQSYRSIVPEIKEIMSLKELVHEDADLKIVLSLDENAKILKKILQNDKKYDRIIIVVGPEGGITKKEEEFLEENGFIKVSLGDRVMRAETASIYITSILNYYFMR